jgi:plastocyanin
MRRWSILVFMVLLPLTGMVRAAAPAAAGSVGGTVVAAGLKTNADIVVSLEAPGLLLKPPAAPVKMDQKSLLFVPHVVAVVRGTTVRFLNNDPEPHNVYSPEGRYNLGTWPPGETRDYTFTQAGVFTQLCRIHPDMLAFVVVLDTPHFAVTDKAGRFRIAGVPPGKYTLVAWSEEYDFVEQPVTVKAGAELSVELKMGR